MPCYCRGEWKSRVFTLLPLILSGGGETSYYFRWAEVVTSYGTHGVKGREKGGERFVSIQWLENSVSLLCSLTAP